VVPATTRLPQIAAASADVPVRALLADAIAMLAAAGLPTARLDAEHLLADLLGVERLRLYTDSPALSPRQVRRYREAVARRAAGAPLQYLRGWEEFRGLRFTVSRATLIPRGETEGLVEWALELTPPSATVCDLGTGTGCVACAIATARRDVRVLAVERSPTALAVAVGNVRALGLGDRVTLIAGDLFAPIPAIPLDVVVANPPYIPSTLLPALPAEVRDWEPREALDGGDDGMALHRRIVAGAPAVLRRGGALLMEIGDGQAAPLLRAMREAGFVEVATRRDLAGVDRYIAGSLDSPSGPLRRAGVASLGIVGSVRLAAAPGTAARRAGIPPVEAK
jgi:release factor glutamine methyltransferase